MTIVKQLRDKIKEDTGLTAPLAGWINEESAQKALNSDAKFVAVNETNFVDGDSVLNPGKVFLEGHREINYTITPFRVLYRTWGPNGLSR